MIPIKLRLSGFLSYRDEVELDFSSLELACISGPNGAGKSSLLDAITWALFGQARKRDESLINSHPEVKAAEVEFIFEYEGNQYRVLRANPRNKTSALEFSILQANGVWKPLSERSLRETQASIENVLRLDYETFVNASFFLQGKADLFTQQRSSDRKRILGNILGLEQWEVYRQWTLDLRKSVEGEIGAIDGRLQEIIAELNEEPTRRSRLESLIADLARQSQARAAQETALENARKTTAVLAEQRRLVETLRSAVEGTTGQLQELAQRLSARRDEQAAFASLLARSQAISSAYQAWQEARQELERWDEVAARFRQHEKRRQAPLDEINAERARLLQEQANLQDQQAQAQANQEAQVELADQLDAAQQNLEAVEIRLAQRENLETQLSQGRRQQAEARAENPLLRKQMDDLKARIEQLEALDSPVCPFCGQPLSEEDRLRLIADLNEEGAGMGDRFRANQALIRTTDQLVEGLEAELRTMGGIERERVAISQVIARLNTRLGALQEAVQQWQAQGLPRLLQVNAALENDTYAQEARLRLAQIDAELKEIGYDAAAHDSIRRCEQEGRSSEADLRELEKAQTTQASLAREIGELEMQQQTLQKIVAQQQQTHEAAAAALAQAETQAPDLYTTERELYNLQEQENRLRMEVGAAQQAVLVLDDLKARRQRLEIERESLAIRVGQYKQLERAFSKDGVPALLIEQALPQIEARANEILDRLSGGSMSVRFVTQAAYKDKRREDLRETLDILISDGSGTRDYEMYSGGEAFRVNFAIRLALSEVLAQRAGARLQMLVIDEGFGSQDAQGRQRLIEAINLVRQDFAKILVITHLDELKDAFPTRIEVEKTDRGSRLRVL